MKKWDLMRITTILRLKAAKSNINSRTDVTIFQQRGNFAGYCLCFRKASLRFCLCFREIPVRFCLCFRKISLRFCLCFRKKPYLVQYKSTV